MKRCRIENKPNPEKNGIEKQVFWSTESVTARLNADDSLNISIASFILIYTQSICMEILSTVWSLRVSVHVIDWNHPAISEFEVFELEFG